MSDSSSSSAAAPKLDSISAKEPTPNVTSTTTTTPTEPATTTTAIVSPLREDMIKPAVSFLTSPNVKSAGKAKKIAFLQKKGLNQAEIDDAFKRTGNDNVPAEVPAAVSTTTTTTAYTPPTQQQNNAPVLPSRNNLNYGPSQIVYYPQPPNPPIPAEKVFAVAVILGMGAVGLTAGVVGILRRFIAPIFNRIAEYQRTRYNQHKVIADKLYNSLTSFRTENDDLDALMDQGDEKTVVDTLIKQQFELSSKMDTLVGTSKERIQSVLKQRTYGDFRTELTSFRNMITDTSNVTYYRTNRYSNDPPAISLLKNDIRSLKAILLNRRNFPAIV